MTETMPTERECHASLVRLLGLTTIPHRATRRHIFFPDMTDPCIIHPSGNLERGTGRIINHADFHRKVTTIFPDALELNHGYQREWLFKLFCEAKRVYLDKVSLQILCWNITYI